MYVSLLVVSVLAFAAALIVYFRHPAASVFHPATFYLLFHGLVFVVRPLFAWHYGYDNIYQLIGFEPSEWEKTQVLICTNLGLVAFMAASLRFAGQPLAFRQDEADLAERGALLRLFWLVAVPLGALAAYALYWQWDVIASGENPRIVDQRTGWGAQRIGSGYFVAAAMMLGPIAVMIAFLGRFRWWSLLPFAGFTVLRLGTGNRGDLVAAAVMLAVLFLFDRRWKWPNALMLAGALALVALFAAMQEDRGSTIREFFRPNVEDKASFLQPERAPLESMDIANLEFFEYLVWAIPKRTGSYDYFAHNLQLITEPVPRALWPGKPVGPPVVLFDLYDGTRTIPITFSVPGTGWYSAGYLGVALWCALFGLIYGGGYKWLARGRQGNLTVIAYAILLSTAPVAFRDGLLLTLAKQMAFYGAPLAILALMVRIRPLQAPRES